MKIKLPIVILAVFLCLMVVFFRSLLISVDANTGTAASLERTSQGSRHLPVLLPARPPIPEVAVPAVVPAEQPEQRTYISRSEPLTPEMENSRLRRIINDSGIAAGDALDRISRDIAGDLVTQLRSHKAEVTLQAMECRAAGCMATLEVGTDADYFRLRNLFEGMDRRSPLMRWPGSRVIPPLIHHNDKLNVSIMLIRLDSKVNF